MTEPSITVEENIKKSRPGDRDLCLYGGLCIAFSTIQGFQRLIASFARYLTTRAGRDRFLLSTHKRQINPLCAFALRHRPLELHAVAKRTVRHGCHNLINAGGISG